MYSPLIAFQIKAPLSVLPPPKVEFNIGFTFITRVRVPDVPIISYVPSFSKIKALGLGSKDGTVPGQGVKVPWIKGGNS